MPDPFTDKYPSFGAGNNARLRAFLDRFGFEYEFMSATETYRSGRFDATLLTMLAHYDEVKAIILPTLGPERRATYSPFLPISPRTGIVLQVPTVARDPTAGTIIYLDPDTGEEVTTLVTGGRVKCQWKADWALRWVALGVDYEMSGKDLIDSVTLSSQGLQGARRHAAGRLQLRALPRRERPEDLEVEGERPDHRRLADLCLAGEPVALHVPEAARGEAALLRRDPARRRRIFPVPRRLSAAGHAEPARQIPVWHIHSGHPPDESMPVPFSMLLNLASASNTEDADMLWGFITRHRPGVTQGERAGARPPGPIRGALLP